MNRNDGWIDAALVEPGKAVLAAYKRENGKGVVVKAQFIAKFTEESRGDYEDFWEYNEDDDTYYIPEGWYEMIDNWPEYYRVYITEGTVTHFMALPKFD